MAHELHEAVRFADHRLRAVIALPPAGRTEAETLCLALQLVLERDFNIHFPPDQMRLVREGAPARFLEAGKRGDLPRRRVAVLPAAELRRVEIAGVEPENGMDGWSELHFAWQRRAGMEDERGNIDWKRLNTFPHVTAGALLAVLHPHTAGRPGVDAAGKRIKQRPGRPLKVKWDEKTIQARRDEGGRLLLTARAAGIVDFQLERAGDARTLSRLAITDTITINGDVDYRIGDQGSHEREELSCHANIVVTGDVLGIFSLQSEGFIHVRGAIEGRRVEAAEVEAGVITAGTTVQGHRSVVADNVVRATVQGGEVIIRRNVNGATVIGRSAVRLGPTTAVLGATFHTPSLTAEGSRFSGRTRVILGEEFFAAEKEVIQALARARNDLDKTQAPLRRAVQNAADQLTALERVVSRSCSPMPPPLAKMLAVLKQRFVTAVRRPQGPLDDDFFLLCRRFQDALADHGVHHTVHGKVDVFLRVLGPLQERLTESGERLQAHTAARERLADLRRRAAALEFSCQEIRLTATAEIEIEAGGARLVLTNATLPHGPFSVVYRPPAEDDRLSGGSLEIEAISESF